mmetsp:Transcript_9659/g.16107  ORF Transcript_9659/g.16107 Transcript_9659/m.16107 type:complete len:240 (+) Transcript_9659:1316-2035(+)
MTIVTMTMAKKQGLRTRPIKAPFIYIPSTATTRDRTRSTSGSAPMDVGRWLGSTTSSFLRTVCCWGPVHTTNACTVTMCPRWRLAASTPRKMGPGRRGRTASLPSPASSSTSTPRPSCTSTSVWTVCTSRATARRRSCCLAPWRRASRRPRRANSRTTTGSWTTSSRSAGGPRRRASWAGRCRASGRRARTPPTSTRWIWTPTGSCWPRRMTSGPSSCSDTPACRTAASALSSTDTPRM